MVLTSYVVDHLIPFFRSSAVCFVHDNNIIPMCDWKSAYAECNPQIPKLTKKGFDGFADISGGIQIPLFQNQQKLY